MEKILGWKIPSCWFEQRTLPTYMSIALTFVKISFLKVIKDRIMMNSTIDLGNNYQLKKKWQPNQHEQITSLQEAKQTLEIIILRRFFTVFHQNICLKRFSFWSKWSLSIYLVPNTFASNTNFFLLFFGHATKILSPHTNKSVGGYVHIYQRQET